EMRYALVVVLVCSVGGGCDGPEGSGDDGVGAIQSPAFGGGANDDGAYYRLKSVATGFCVDVNGNAQTDGAQVLQWDCGGGENQRWYFRAVLDGHYQLAAKHSAKCLRVAGGATGSGAGYVQDPCARSGGGN